jgi:hypothetical protein
MWSWSGPASNPPPVRCSRCCWTSWTAASSASSTSPSWPTTGTVQQLKDLAELKNQGILTEEEFAAQKARILSG